jgi:hypothetical protein
MINKMSMMAENIVNGNPISHQTEELKNFNTYFSNPNYDAFLIDNALKGNSLLFTMMYIYYQMGWKAKLPQVNEEAFKNLAYKLQTVYRLNFYHNQIHGADVCQLLHYLFTKVGLT